MTRRPSMTPPSPSSLPESPAQVVPTVRKISLLDEKNVYLIQDSEASSVDCIPGRNKNPGAVAF